MNENTSVTIGVVLIEKFADWEFGLLSAGAAEHFGAKVIFLSPDGKAVTSIGGLEAQPSRGVLPAENVDLDAVALIGSENWATDYAPDVSLLLASVQARGGVIGGICAGTIALVHGGFVSGVKHTSNGSDWIASKAGTYPGHELYQDVPYAIGDNRVVTAPGSAPVSFAAEFLAQVFPQLREATQGVKSMFAAEHS